MDLHYHKNILTAVRCKNNNILETWYIHLSTAKWYCSKKKKKYVIYYYIHILITYNKETNKFKEIEKFRKSVLPHSCSMKIVSKRKYKSEVKVNWFHGAVSVRYECTITSLYLIQLLLCYYNISLIKTN